MARLTVSERFNPVTFHAETKLYGEDIADLFRGLATVVISTGAANLQFYATEDECLQMADKLYEAAEQIALQRAVIKMCEVA